MTHRIVIAGAGALARELNAWLRDDGFDGEIVHVIIHPDGSMPDPFEHRGDDAWTCAIADSTIRHRITCGPLADKLVPSFVHNTAVIAKQSSIRTPAMFFPFSLVSVGVSIGMGAVVNVHSSIGHDVVLGDFCTLSAHVDLCGGVHVGDRVFFGSGSRVLPHLKIGDDAIIGAGAVVVHDVPAGATVWGNPARRVK